MNQHFAARSGTKRRGAIVVAMTYAFALQSGCGTLEPAIPLTTHQTQAGVLAVVASAKPPKVARANFVRSPGEAAAYRGGSTFMHCIEAFSHGSCTGDICGAVLLAGLGICSVAGLIGGLSAASSTPSSESLEHTEETVNATPISRDAQRVLRDAALAAALTNGAELVEIPPEQEVAATAANDYRPLAALGADTVLEVQLTQMQPSGEGVDPQVRVNLVADARLVRTRDNTELFAARYLHQGAARTLSQWAADKGKPLERALHEGLGSLGAHIYENVFLLYPYPDRLPHMAGTLSAAFGLAPVAPTTRGQLSGDRILGGRFEWTQVSSLKPQLRWQTFPRPSDMKAAPLDMAKVRNVRYDLVIAREEGMSPGEIVYWREGLAQAAHRLETSLMPDTRYFWSVRARFELDGRVRVTEWSSTHFIAREQWTAPSQWSYRFRTP